MARSPIILQDHVPYHITARCINRDWFTLPIGAVWEIMAEQLHFIHHAYNVQILAFVLMNNHFHLLVRTPDSNLSAAMAWFMRETSRSITRFAERINQTYGGRYFRCLIRTNHYFLNAYKYIYRNPVLAGICDRPEDYRYSSLGGLIGMNHLPIPIEEDLTLFSDVEGTLDWLNRVPDPDHLEAVRKALRRKEFKLTSVRGKPHPLEIDVL